MKYSSLTYHKTKVEAIEKENFFWKVVASPVNQASSDVMEVVHRDNAPSYTKDWLECWACHTHHFGND